MKLTKKELLKIKNTLKELSGVVAMLLHYDSELENYQVFVKGGPTGTRLRGLTDDEQAKMVKKEYNRLNRLVKKINQNLK